MRVFNGQGGSIYAAGDPFAFTSVPLVDCGDGFTWRSADDTLRCWVDQGPFLFEALEQGEWRPVGALAVRHAAATVAFGRCLSGLEVRASGTALPTSLLATGTDWTLRQSILESRTLGGGPAFVNGSTVARLRGVPDDAWSALAHVRRVLAVLPSAAIGAFVGVGELARDTPDLKVTFDDRGVTYATG